MLVVLAAPAVVAVAPPTDGYDLAVAHRRAGRHEEAVEGFRAVLRQRPDHVDALVGMGLSLAALGQRYAAEQALSRAVELAPGYWDAHVGLARLAYAAGDPSTARSRLAPVLAGSPEQQDALELAAALDRAELASVARTRVRRLDVWAGGSRLSADLPSWREAGFVVTLPATEQLSVHLGAQTTERFNQSDLYLEAGFRRQAPGGGSWGLALGGAPVADHRPEISVSGSAVVPVRAGVSFTLNGALSRYPTVEVVSFSPGLELAAGARTILSGRWIAVAAEGDDLLSGYGVRVDFAAAPSTWLSLGWTDAPESSDGRPAPVEALSASASRDVTDSFTLRLTGTHETRSNYTRDEIALGAAVRF